MNGPRLAFPEGHEFWNPDNSGEGYRLTCDVNTYDHVRADQFEAFGGAPEPKPGHPMPDWLAKQTAPRV